MRMNRISLEKRLGNIEQGYAADPEFNSRTIQSLASIPICDYMAEFEEENERIKEILGLSQEEEARMTYRDIACEIDTLYKKSQDRQEAYEALELLTLPFRHCYEERKECYD